MATSSWSRSLETQEQHSVCAWQEPRGVEADGGAQDTLDLLLSEEDYIRGASFRHAIGVEYRGLSGGEMGFLVRRVKKVNKGAFQGIVFL
jgi:hypothetical protein